MSGVFGEVRTRHGHGWELHNQRRTPNELPAVAHTARRWLSSAGDQNLEAILTSGTYRIT